MSAQPQFYLYANQDSIESKQGNRVANPGDILIAVDPEPFAIEVDEFDIGLFEEVEVMRMKLHNQPDDEEFFLIPVEDLRQIEGMRLVYRLIESDSGIPVAPFFGDLEKLHAYAEAMNFAKVSPRVRPNSDQPYLAHHIVREIVID